MRSNGPSARRTSTGLTPRELLLVTFESRRTGDIDTSVLGVRKCSLTGEMDSLTLLGLGRAGGVAERSGVTEMGVPPFILLLATRLPSVMSLNDCDCQAVPRGNWGGFESTVECGSGGVWPGDEGD